MDGAIDGPNAAIDGQQDDCDGTVMFLQCTLSAAAEVLNGSIHHT